MGSLASSGSKALFGSRYHRLGDYPSLGVGEGALNIKILDKSLSSALQKKKCVKL